MRSQINEVSNKSGNSPKASRVCAFLSSWKVVLEQVKASSFLESSPRLRPSLPLPEEATFGRAALPRQKFFTRDSSDADGAFRIDGAFWLPGSLAGRTAAATKIPLQGPIACRFHPVVSLSGASAYLSHQLAWGSPSKNHH